MDCWSNLAEEEPSTPEFQQPGLVSAGQAGATAQHPPWTNAVSHKALLRDAPYIPSTTDGFVYEFYAFAWCMKGNDCPDPRWYEGIRWCYISQRGVSVSRGWSYLLEQNVRPKPSADLLEAFQKFCTAKKFTPCR